MRLLKWTYNWTIIQFKREISRIIEQILKWILIMLILILITMRMRIKRRQNIKILNLIYYLIWYTDYRVGI